MYYSSEGYNLIYAFFCCVSMAFRTFLNPARSQNWLKTKKRSITERNCRFKFDWNHALKYLLGSARGAHQVKRKARQENRPFQRRLRYVKCSNKDCFMCAHVWDKLKCIPQLYAQSINDRRNSGNANLSGVFSFGATPCAHFLTIRTETDLSRVEFGLVMYLPGYVCSSRNCCVKIP